MIHKTRGIVLRTLDYSDTSIIAKIFTEQFGIQSYLIRGAKRKKAPVRANLFQPLSSLELVVYKKEKKQLQTIKEVKSEMQFAAIPNDMAKTSILFFLNEILFRCLQEEEHNPELFSFLHESLQALDNAEKHFSNLHLIFLVRFSRFLGFFPQGTFSENISIFDLREGRFVSSEPLHPEFLSKESSRTLGKVLRSNYYNMENLSLTGEERKHLLHALLRYYDLHIPTMRDVSSHKVLEQVLG